MKKELILLFIVIIIITAGLVGNGTIATQKGSSIANIGINDALMGMGDQDEEEIYIQLNQWQAFNAREAYLRGSTKEVIFYRGDFDENTLIDSDSSTSTKTFSGFNYAIKKGQPAKVNIYCESTGEKLVEKLDALNIEKEKDPLKICNSETTSCCVTILYKTPIVPQNPLLSTLTQIFLLAAVFISILGYLLYLAFVQYKKLNSFEKVFFSVSALPTVGSIIYLIPLLMNPLSIIWGFAFGGIFWLLFLIIAAVPLILMIIVLLNIKNIKNKKWQKTLFIFTCINIIYFAVFITLVLIMLFAGTYVRPIYYPN